MVQANAYWKSAACNHQPPPTYDPNAARLYPPAGSADTQGGQVQAPKSVPAGTDVSKALLGKLHGKAMTVPYPVSATNVPTDDGSLIPSLDPANLNGSANPVTRFSGLNNVLNNPETGHQMASAPWGYWIRGLGH
jgi:hypothetical protein